MVEFVTSAKLRSLASARSITEQASIRKAAANRSPKGATFLSHSSKDEDLVVGATIILESHGARIYLDKIDPEIPPYTSAETARILKKRIQYSKKFVLLTSVNSKGSRWVPWELGVADGYKTMKHIALFPSSNTAKDISWAEWEYLGLYRRIVWGKLRGHSDNVWLVWNHITNRATELSRWLNE